MKYKFETQFEQQNNLSYLQGKGKNPRHRQLHGTQLCGGGING